MGSSCCSSDNPNNMQHTTDTITKQSERPRKNITTPMDNPSIPTTDSQSSADSESEFNMDSNNYLNNPKQYSMEATPDIPHTTTEKEKAKTGFQDAIQKGNDSLAMHFVQEYPELDLLQTTFENGDNPLQIAVKNKSHNLILYLLENGVSPNAQNHKDGETALHSAVRTRDVKIVALLSKYLADPAITNKAYETPLMIASDNKDDDIIELLAPDTLEEVRKRISSAISDSDEEPMPNDIKRQTSYSVHAHVNDILSDHSDEEYIDSQTLLKDSNETLVYNMKKRSSAIETFEHNLSDAERQKIHAMKVAREINPFTKLKSVNTKKALMEMEQISKADDLPKLQGWLEKKQSTMPYQWQRRWVVVKGSHLLWSDIQRDIKDAKNMKERKKFNNSISLMSISEIKEVTKGKTQRKFTLDVGTNKKRKEYLWKCATKTDRDFWVKGLKKHIAHTKAFRNYFGTK